MDVDECGLLLRAALSHVLSLDAPNSGAQGGGEWGGRQGEGANGGMSVGITVSVSGMAVGVSVAPQASPVCPWGGDAARGAADGVWASVWARVREVLESLVGGEGGLVWRRLVRMVGRRLLSLPVPSPLIDYVERLQASACQCAWVCTSCACECTWCAWWCAWWVWGGAYAWAPGCACTMLVRASRRCVQVNK